MATIEAKLEARRTALPIKPSHYGSVYAFLPSRKAVLDLAIERVTKGWTCNAPRGDNEDCVFTAIHRGHKMHNVSWIVDELERHLGLASTVSRYPLFDWNRLATRDQVIDALRQLRDKPARRV